ncbi:U1 small nuclear ribonucleoprotein C-like [Camellia sinensis]|uniref:U1 small nuclear ribonucleoprotein C-like n=1 Tax=Camellia sinensis TaxID=4442 RepID=UPI00103604A7|nr:U1 small nuclear ribonucleoprotein C-like [Camellia sinensis]
MSAPVMPPMVGPPAAAAALPGQITNLPRPPPMGAPSAVPGTTMTPASVSTSMVTPAMYQAANSAPPTSGGYMSALVMPPMVGPPVAAAALPGQITNLPRPPPMGAPSAVPGTTMTPASVSTSMVTPAMYQAANSATPTSGGFDSFNMSAQAPEADH